MEPKPSLHAIMKLNQSNKHSAMSDNKKMTGFRWTFVYVLCCLDNF